MAFVAGFTGIIWKDRDVANSRSRRTGAPRKTLFRKLLPSVMILAIAIGPWYALSQSKDGWILPGESNGGPASRWATVATDTLNVREGPSTAAQVLDSLASGAEVEVIGGAEAGFVPVAYGGGQAWLAQEYLSFDGPTRSVSINPLPVRDALAAVEPIVAIEPEAEQADPMVTEFESEQAKSAAEPEAAAPAPAVPEEPAEPTERWIDIDRSAATVTLYEGDVSIASFSGKIGRDPSPDGFYSTAIGTFHVYSLNKGLAPTPFAEDTFLTDWVGFDPERKNGIHSPVRDADGVEKAWQNPATLGCVRLNAAAAEAVFDFAEIGMLVEVHD